MIKTLPLFLFTFLLMPTFSHADTEVEPPAFFVPPEDTSIFVTNTTNAEATLTASATPVLEVNESGETTGIEYEPKSHSAPCIDIDEDGNVIPSTTCITKQMITNANNAYVYKSPIITYLPFVNPPEANEDGDIICNAPTATNMIVYRQTLSEEGFGMIQEVPDAFCLNQGCVYFARNEAEEGEEEEIVPKCVYGS